MRQDVYDLPSRRAPARVAHNIPPHEASRLRRRWKMKSAIAIRFVHFEDLGSFETVLTDNGFKVEYVDVTGDGIRGLDPLEKDLLVSLGGPIGAYEDDVYPALTPVLRILERRLAADRPTLGICLGAQLIAR